MSARKVKLDLYVIFKKCTFIKIQHFHICIYESAEFFCFYEEKVVMLR
jgi:hypothetical protein